MKGQLLSIKLSSPVSTILRILADISLTMGVFTENIFVTH